LLPEFVKFPFRFPVEFLGLLFRIVLGGDDFVRGFGG
jgi:hypothetical protein